MRTHNEPGERVKKICKLYYDGMSLSDIAIEIYSCKPESNLHYIRINTCRTLLLMNYEKIYGIRLT